MYPPHILLHYQQGKVRWHNSSVEKSRDCRCLWQTYLDSIREIHIGVSSVLFRWTPAPALRTQLTTPLVCLVCGNAAPRLRSHLVQSQSTVPEKIHRPLNQPATCRQISTFPYPSRLCSPVKSMWYVSVCKQILWLDLWMCVSDRKDWCTRIESSPEHSAFSFFFFC